MSMNNLWHNGIMHKLRKYAWAFILLVVVIALGGAYLLFHKTSDDAISETEAFSLIRQCKVDGTYSYHNGEVGIILKPTPGEALQGASVNSSPTDNFRLVKGTTEERLRQDENPACPFTRRAIE